MSIFSKVGNAIKGAAETVGNVASDLGKGVAYVAVAPVNSITGHTYSPNLETGVGKIASGLTIQGTDSVHVLGKTFGDAISFGNATKLANKFRSAENKEAVGLYNEAKIKTDLPGLSKFESFSKSGAALIGKVYGSKAAEKGQEQVKALAETKATNLLTNVQNLKGPNMSGIDKILSGAKNALRGINIGQAVKDAAGNISVPSGQAGSGIFNSLINTAARALGGTSVKIQTSPAANQGTTASVNLGGGVTVTGQGTIGKPVSEQSGIGGTTTSSKSSSIPGWVWIILAVFGLSMLSGNKKIF